MKTTRQHLIEAHYQSIIRALDRGYTYEDSREEGPHEVNTYWEWLEYGEFQVSACHDEPDLYAWITAAVISERGLGLIDTVQLMDNEDFMEELANLLGHLHLTSVFEEIITTTIDPLNEGHTSVDVHWNDSLATIEYGRSGGTTAYAAACALYWVETTARFIWNGSVDRLIHETLQGQDDQLTHNIEMAIKRHSK